jgi:hypothetical protein
MVVVAVEAEEQGCGAAGWGTWEELVLGGAVQRHGPASWHAVAAELRSRSPASFSPEVRTTPLRPTLAYRWITITTPLRACNVARIRAG